MAEADRIVIDIRTDSPLFQRASEVAAAVMLATANAESGLDRNRAILGWELEEALAEMEGSWDFRAAFSMALARLTLGALVWAAKEAGVPNDEVGAWVRRVLPTLVQVMGKEPDDARSDSL